MINADHANSKFKDSINTEEPGHRTGQNKAATQRTHSCILQKQKQKKMGGRRGGGQWKGPGQAWEVSLCEPNDVQQGRVPGAAPALGQS